MGETVATHANVRQEIALSQNSRELTEASVYLTGCIRDLARGVSEIDLETGSRQFAGASPLSMEDAKPDRPRKVSRPYRRPFTFEAF